MATARLQTGPPAVRLLAHTGDPFALSVASARTCYSPDLKTVADVTPEQKQRIGRMIFDGGHHTPFQHPTFVFGLENVTRQFAWSFLHAHPFYNSEQSSQRYNVLKEAKAYLPPLTGDARRAYEDAILRAWEAYFRLEELLLPATRRIMGPLGRVRQMSDKKTESEATKKAAETARYVLPLGAFTAMYHTVSGIELQRYLRMANTGDCPTETRQVVQAMVEEVRRVDPDFLGQLDVVPMPERDVLENRVRVEADPHFAERFDKNLQARSSKLVAFTQQGEELVADTAREVLGATPAQMTDEDAIEAVLDPARNPHLLDTLNTWTHSPLMRSLNHVTYTFRKKLSHAADSQDQRHRMVPASRPLLTRVHTREPDYVTPDLVAASPEAKAVYDRTMRELWDAKNRLLELGVPTEFALYVLPNATAVRFTSTGSLLHYLHKWRMRTCFNAQREIYEASMEELAQVRAVHPRLTRHIGPPCVFREGLAPEHPVQGPCPEPTWCGIQVWRNFPNVKRVV